MTNTTNLTMQLIAQSQSAKAPAKQPQTPKTSASEKSFKDAMQKAMNQPAAKAETQPTRTTSAQQSQERRQTADAVLEEGKTADTAAAEAANNRIQDGEVQSKWNFLASLFGVGAVDGVDMEQSDMDILKDVYKNVTDPAAQFALMLMMAFLEANPDKTIGDFQQQLGQDLLDNPDVSPTQKVLSAITRLMAGDPDIKGSDMLDQLMQMARNAGTSRAVVSTQQFKELEAQLLTGGQSKADSTTQTMAQTTAQTQVVVQQLPVKDTMAQLRFEDTVAQARQLMQKQLGEKADTNGTGEKRESGVKLDVDKLQQQVDAGSFMRNTGHAAFRLEQAGAVPVQVPVDPAELVNQVKTGLLGGVEKGSNDFVMKLRPEGLGELTIHLSESEGKTTLSIVASNLQTQKLLIGELANLQAAMKPLHVEVLPVVATSQEASTADQNLFGQPAQQQFGEHNHNGGQFAGHPAEQSWQEIEELEADTPASYLRTDGTAALDTYI